MVQQATNHPKYTNIHKGTMLVFNSTPYTFYNVYFYIKHNYRLECFGVITYWRELLPQTDQHKLG